MMSTPIHFPELALSGSGILSLFFTALVFLLSMSSLFGASLDMTAFQYALKELYAGSRVASIFFKNNALLAMIRKSTDFYGDKKVIPVQHSNPSGRSRDLATARTNRKASKGVKFELTHVKDYGVVEFDRLVMKASSKDIGSFIAGKKNEIDGIMREVSRSMARGIYGDRWAVIGQISAGSSVASDTITLAVLSDAVNFEVGMNVDLSASASSGSVRAGTLEVEAVDYELGTITFTGVVTAGVAAAAVLDFISVEGDFGVGISGLAAWFPTTAPTGGDSHFGVDRSVNPSRLAGLRHDGTGDAIEEAFQEFLNKFTVHGEGPDYIFCNPKQWLRLSIATGAKVQYVNPSGGAAAHIGFKGIAINANYGECVVLADQNCPNAKAYGLTMETIGWEGLGEAPEIFDEDGVSMLRSTDADSFEVRCGYYGNFASERPIANGVLTLDVAT